MLGLALGLDEADEVKVVIRDEDDEEVVASLAPSPVVVSQLPEPLEGSGLGEPLA